MSRAGAILWQGRSALDPRTPIVVIATPDSDNTKTGPMWQTWILCRDRHPMDATGGGDEPICGTCRHRPDALGTCYVNLAWAPANVWRTYRAGGYETAPPRTWGAGVRFGAYGDPAAAPLWLWEGIADTLRFEGRGWTGYTDQWRTCDPRFSHLLMASVDTAEEAATATAAGWRTFRVRTPDEVLHAQEIVCPASDEGGHRVTCARCLLCMGGSKPAKSIAIAIHGSTQRPFYATRQPDLKGL